MTSIQKSQPEITQIVVLHLKSPNLFFTILSLFISFGISKNRKNLSIPLGENFFRTLNNNLKRNSKGFSVDSLANVNMAESTTAIWMKGKAKLQEQVALPTFVVVYKVHIHKINSPASGYRPFVLPLASSTLNSFFFVRVFFLHSSPHTHTLELLLF